MELSLPVSTKDQFCEYQNTKWIESIACKFYKTNKRSLLHILCAPDILRVKEEVG